MRISGLLAGATLIGSMGALLAPISASPISAPAAARPETVTVALVGHYFACPLRYSWETLSTQWSSYGSVPLSIVSDEALCSETFTLADLEASGADTLVFAASSVGVGLDEAEITAVQTYAEEGHNLVATSLSFGGGDGDNNALAPSFGLAEQPVWHRQFDSSFSYSIKKKAPGVKPLFRHVANPYVSATRARGLRPADSNWTRDDLAGATFIGNTADKKAAITLYHGSGYSAITIANTPEIESTPDDLQFLYNALIYPQHG